MSSRNKLISRAKRIFTSKASCIAGEAGSRDSLTLPPAPSIHGQGAEIDNYPRGQTSTATHPITQPLIPYDNCGDIASNSPDTSNTTYADVCQSRVPSPPTSHSAIDQHRCGDILPSTTASSVHPPLSPPSSASTTDAESTVATSQDGSSSHHECLCPTHARRRRWLLPLRRRRRHSPCAYCRQRVHAGDGVEQAVHISAGEASQYPASPRLETTDNSGLDRDANFVIPTSPSQCEVMGGDQHMQSPSSGHHLPISSSESARDHRNLNNEIFTEGRLELVNRVHTQVDYQHCLVPDLSSIARCPYYWGEMDRYAAESLLQKSEEGSFLLRDSAQDGYIFSVSFRRYGRSLHARVEQLNHRFSFDCHDNGIFSCPSVNGLIEHYKDPERCMFFEPLLTLPVYRRQPFSLQHLSRAVVCTHVCANDYDALQRLPLPKPLVDYLRYYHYRRSVGVRELTPSYRVHATPTPPPPPAAVAS